MKTDNVNFYLKSTLVKTTFDVDDDHIKSVERIVRNSLEYKKVIADKRGNENENKCELLSDYDFKDKKTTLEMHHIVPLYDICQAVYLKLLKENPTEYITTFEVANEVMKYHYQNAFLYVFVSKTVHQLIHTNQYQVPVEDIKGNANLLKSMLYDYLDEDNKDIIDEVINGQVNSSKE